MRSIDNEYYLKSIVSNLPEGPGCYQYLDETNKIIYVGKAKNLKRRVSSYFNKDHGQTKTGILVKKIRDIKYIVVNSEEDALILENNLIKRYKPRYNVLLKDDKTYPSICITNETFPRIFQTRHIDKKVGTYFGPYSHIQTMYTLLDLIKRNYKIRSCRYPLTEDSITKGKYKVCLDYHIRKCDGVCIGNISASEYQKEIAEIKQILRGNTTDVCKALKEEMVILSEEMRFEEAQNIKVKLEQISNYIAKSEVVSQTITNVDVYNIEEDEDENIAFINYLHITHGVINQAFTFEYKKRVEESKEELLSLGIIDMRIKYNSQSREIIIPFELDLNLKDITFTIPERGDKKHLLDLSKLNVKQYRLDRQKKQDKLNPEQKQTRLLKELQELLHLEHLPIRIECFDNSNISGSDAVAGCVTFIQGRPSKKDYRKYNIKTVIGPDDYASMQEVVKRKYTRAINENSPLPDLIITDGGKGQMSVVKEIINELHLAIPIAGLAKNNKHKTSELIYGDPPVTVGAKEGTPLFNLLTRIQDEVHRYAITFHRNKRSKHQIESELDTIKGIGKTTKNKLLKEFKSKKRIKELSLDELTKSIGKSKAQIIFSFFQDQKDEQ